jgi:hypothetical protein
MYRGIAVSSAALLLCAGLVFAQSNTNYLTGAVTAVKPDMVIIKTQDGKFETVMLEKTTTYMKGRKLAHNADLKVGEDVTINTKMDAKTKKYFAEEVTLDAKLAKAKPAAVKK